MLKKKGVGAMVVVVIILSLIGVTVLLNIFWTIAEPLFINTFGCDIYCNIHREAEGYSTLAWWPGWLGGSVTWSDIIIDSVRAGMARPAAAGCYCGVAEREGKYMHIRTTKEPHNINEFHLTQQNPGYHLNYTATGFDHSGGREDCEEVADQNFDGFSGMVYTEACFMISVQEQNGDYDCRVWKAGEGSVLKNEDGETVESMLVNDENHGDNFNDPVEELEIGEDVGLSGPHPSQRMLIQNVSEESTEFRLAAPVICKTDGREERSADSELDKACRDYCSDEGQIFWHSTCSETPVEEYDLLPEEYRGDEDLCPELGSHEDRQLERGGDPYCRCKAEEEYFWQVDEDYDPEVD